MFCTAALTSVFFHTSETCDVLHRCFCKQLQYLPLPVRPLSLRLSSSTHSPLASALTSLFAEGSDQLLVHAGRPGRSAHAAEEVDVLPESQAGVLHAGAQLRLQRGARRLHPEGGGLEGHGHLRGLYLSVVCVVGSVFFTVSHIRSLGKVENQSLLPLGSHSAGATWACRRCAPTT